MLSNPIKLSIQKVYKLRNDSIFMEQEPVLIYGVNMGRIPKTRIHFSEGVINKDGFLDLTALNVHAGIENLTVLSNSDAQDFYNPNELDKLQIGVQIGMALVPGLRLHNKKRYEDEARFFDVDQIVALRQNPSGLIKRLKKVGLDVNPAELTLYGVAEEI